MESQLKKSKFMYYYVIAFTVLIIIGNIILLIISLSLTKPIYTREMNYGGGLIGTITYDSPIYPVLKTNQVLLISLFLLVNIGLFSYFLYCFVNDKVKISKIFGIILFGLTAILSLIQLKFLGVILSLLVVGYLANIKTSNLSIKKIKGTA